MPKRSAKTAKTVSENAAAIPSANRLEFFDASAIVKAYVREPETASVRRWLSQSIAVVSRITQVEVASAISRRRRAGLLSNEQHRAAVAALLTDFDRWVAVELTDAVARRANQLLETHHLRAGDAIQLASALEARDRLQPAFGRFVAYDARLCAAARAEALSTVAY